MKALLGCALLALWSTTAAAKPRARPTRPVKPKPAPAPVEPEPIEMTETPAPAPVIETDAPAAIVDRASGSGSGTIAPVAPVRQAPPPARRPFYIRGGVAVVAPLATSRELALADVDGAASLAVHNGPIAGSGATVSSATIPAFVLGYVLPIADGRLSIETVLGIPFTVKFRATGSLANESIAPMALGIPTGVPALGPELGEAKAIPPLVTLVYQLPHLGPLRPFAGAGISVLFAYDARVTNPILTEVSQPTMEIAPAPGLVLQTGAEVKLSQRFYARLDVKFIAFMLARARVSHIQVRTPELPVFDTVEVGTAEMNVWVNPLVVQLGIGADF